MLDWAKKLKAKMLFNDVSSNALADHLGVSKPYVSMVLHGREKPKDAEARFNKAVDEIIADK